MTVATELARELHALQALAAQILATVERESVSLRRAEGAGPLEPGSSAPRKKFLAQLSESINKIRQHRVAWLQLDISERQGYPEIAELLRETQNLLMKILVLDRENEQALLRKGLVPNRQIPSARRQQPHFVANLYERNSQPGPSRA
jgi:hypothetical protein